MKTSKTEVLQAGEDISSRSTLQQRENHHKVLVWIIDSLSEEQIPDYSHHKEGRAAGAMLSYKMLIRVWFDLKLSDPKSENSGA